MNSVPLEIVGIFHDHSGYATHTRAVTRQLIKAGFNPKLISYNNTKPIPFNDLRPYQKTVLPNQKPIIRLVFLPPHPVYQKNRYTILYTMMETATLHPGVITRLKTADEVWTPNIYNVAQFRARLPKQIPVHFMSEGTDTTLYNPNVPQMDIRSGADFVAVSVFSWQWRKGPDILLQAWMKAFTSKHNARLILRTTVPFVSKTEGRQIIQNEIRKAMYLTNNPDPAPIEICDSYLPEQQMPAFYTAADCFILPTRGEGWCLPAIDAMACGLPTIITKSTGQIAYCNNSNSVLVNPKGRSTFIPEKIRLMDFYNNQKFFEPDVNGFTQALKQLYSNKKLCQNLGQQAAKDIKNKWNWASVCAPIKKRLAEIQTNL